MFLKMMQNKCLMLLVLVAANASLFATPGMAQEGDLDAGLLELLDSETKPEEGRPDVKPEDIGLDGKEDKPVDPVEAVRQSMLIAAEYLSQGFTNSQTQTLQRDIVTRLDDLIAELEQQQGQQKQQREDSSEQQQSEAQQSSEEQSMQAEPTAGEPEPGSEPSEDGEEGQPNSRNSPGLEGPEANGEVRLAELRKLQEATWGQLPERVRKQMQSQMVERFLPSYRKQIEAYFEALMDAQ